HRTASSSQVCSVLVGLVPAFAMRLLLRTATVALMCGAITAPIPVRECIQFSIRRALGRGADVRVVSGNGERMGPGHEAGAGAARLSPLSPFPPFPLSPF